jgi:hypothetical protein
MTIDGDGMKVSVVWSIKQTCHRGVARLAATTPSITVGHPNLPIANNSDIQ